MAYTGTQLSVVSARSCDIEAEERRHAELCDAQRLLAPEGVTSGYVTLRAVIAMLCCEM
jgi:hypothetical protein